LVLTYPSRRERSAENPRRLASLVTLTAVTLCVGGMGAYCRENAKQEQVFETDITRDINLASGEPQIAVNPRNYRQLAIVEYLYGSKAVPAYSLVLDSEAFWTQWEVKDLTWSLPAHDVTSNDGGNTWVHGVKPGPVFLALGSHRYYGGGDPMIAAGPDGTLYLATEVVPPHPVVPGQSNAVTDWNTGRHVLVYSVDWGKTWSSPEVSNQPIDRPWMKADQTTGKVYVASSGWYDPSTETHNHPNLGTLDRWLVTWDAHLKNRRKPLRIGGPERDLVALHDADLAASHGAVAATFIIGGTGPFAPDAAADASEFHPSHETPASLKRILPRGTECILGKLPACLIFEVSTDDGAHWARYLVPTPPEFDAPGFGGGTNVAADPGRAGRFAVGMEVSGKLMTVVTDDFGKTWSRPAIIPETATGEDFKTRMAYSPNGVLTYVWKKQRVDLNPTPLPAMTESAFDVYAAISCTGGTLWSAAIRVNAKPSPAGESLADDLSYIDADTRYAHLAWGDRRVLYEVRKIAGDVKGQVRQSYYGRVPFSLVTHGEKCGR
jgi:hypothetical protein